MIAMPHYFVYVDRHAKRQSDRHSLQTKTIIPYYEVVEGNYV